MHLSISTTHSHERPEEDCKYVSIQPEHCHADYYAPLDLDPALDPCEDWILQGYWMSEYMAYALLEGDVGERSYARLLRAYYSAQRRVGELVYVDYRP